MEFYLKGVMIPKLLNSPFASCSLINFHFLLLHIAHLLNIIMLYYIHHYIHDYITIVIFETLEFMFSVFFSHFKQ